VNTRLEPRLTHAALRTRVKKVWACAHDNDHARLRRALDELSLALGEHLAAESSMFADLPEPASRRIRAGQERILSAVRTLGADLAVRDQWSDRESLAIELDTLFELQDEVERRSFGDHRETR
jgi:hypothetical protein